MAHIYKYTIRCQCLCRWHRSNRNIADIADKCPKPTLYHSSPAHWYVSRWVCICVWELPWLLGVPSRELFISKSYLARCSTLTSCSRVIISASHARQILRLPALPPAVRQRAACQQVLTWHMPFPPFNCICRLRSCAVYVVQWDFLLVVFLYLDAYTQRLLLLNTLCK